MGRDPPQINPPSSPKSPLPDLCLPPPGAPGAGAEGGGAGGGAEGEGGDGRGFLDGILGGSAHPALCPPCPPQALQDLKADNQRLKDENAALIRVISKLSK